MHFTRRLLERPFSGALVVSSLAISAVSMMASCSSDPDAHADAPQPDGGALDASAAPDVSVPDDGAVVDAGPLSDAATSDAGPRPVSCASASCATSLVTTLGGSALAGMTATEGYCALLHDGTVACWGQNQNGQLGRGLADVESAMPARASGLSNIVALDHTCAVDKDGATWCWGRGPFLGDPPSELTNENTPVKLPVPRATKAAIFAGSPKGPELSLTEFGAVCSVVDDGVLCWGRNDSAQIGPIENSGGLFGSPSLEPRLIPMPPGAKIRSLHLGMASFALREDGTLLSWGFNPTIGRVSSLFPDPQPKPIALTGITNVDTVEAVACAVAEGSVYCWRDVTSLEESFHDHALPARIPTPEPVVQVSTTGRPYARGCVVGISGDVYCWGKNKSGVLGDGTTNDAATPVKVVGLPGPASEVRTTDTSTCALLTTGKVYCWGDDRSGQLGGGTKKPTLVPREVLLP